MTSSGKIAPVAETEIAVRASELDSFGHVNHAVFLAYLEHARYLALQDAGFDWASLDEEGWRIFVVRIEVDYVAEARRGQRLLVRTWAESFRRTMMVLGQEIVRADDPETVVAKARVTAVWIDPGGRPMRVPEHVRAGLSGDRG
jgi:acyl-CoA thioester hydrolase